MIEGTADLVGFRDTYGTDQLTAQRVRTMALTFGRDPTANVSLPRLDQALFDGSMGVDIRYARALLAVIYLVDITSEQKVFVDFYADTVAAGDWEPAFTATFGFTEAQFDQMFTTWVASQP
jgi:hypothetical protein